jgi:hypothetical protein
MIDFLDQILKWSEVWPFILPLTIFLIFKIKQRNLSLVFLYLASAFLLLLLANIIQFYNESLPAFFKNNNIYYNIHSIFRTTLIGIYIIRLKEMCQYRYLKWILSVYIFAVVINFTFFANVTVFSILLVSTESIILLIFSLTYFLGSILDEDATITVKSPAFLICTAISIYESINFFIFLFFTPVFFANENFGYATMQISRASNIILGILFTFAVYYSKTEKEVIKNISTVL